jgi:hypothetical protein
LQIYENTLYPYIFESKNEACIDFTLELTQYQRPVNFDQWTVFLVWILKASVDDSIKKRILVIHLYRLIPDVNPKRLFETTVKSLLPSLTNLDSQEVRDIITESLFSKDYHTDYKSLIGKIEKGVDLASFCKIVIEKLKAKGSTFQKRLFEAFLVEKDPKTFVLIAQLLAAAYEDDELTLGCSVIFIQMLTDLFNVISDRRAVSLAIKCILDLIISNRLFTFYLPLMEELFLAIKAHCNGEKEEFIVSIVYPSLMQMNITWFADDYLKHLLDLVFEKKLSIFFNFFNNLLGLYEKARKLDVFLTSVIQSRNAIISEEMNIHETFRRLPTAIARHLFENVLTPPLLSSANKKRKIEIDPNSFLLRLLSIFVHSTNYTFCNPLSRSFNGDLMTNLHDIMKSNRKSYLILNLHSALLEQYVSYRTQDFKIEFTEKELDKVLKRTENEDEFKAVLNFYWAYVKYYGLNQDRVIEFGLNRYSKITVQSVLNNLEYGFELKRLNKAVLQALLNVDNVADILSQHPDFYEVGCFRDVFVNVLHESNDTLLIIDSLPVEYLHPSLHKKVVQLIMERRIVPQRYLTNVLKAYPSISESIIIEYYPSITNEDLLMVLMTNLASHEKYKDNLRMFCGNILVRRSDSFICRAFMSFQKNPGIIRGALKDNGYKRLSRNELNSGDEFHRYVSELVVFEEHVSIEDLNELVNHASRLKGTCLDILLDYCNLHEDYLNIETITRLVSIWAETGSEFPFSKCSLEVFKLALEKVEEEFKRTKDPRFLSVIYKSMKEKNVQKMVGFNKVLELIYASPFYVSEYGALDCLNFQHSFINNRKNKVNLYTLGSIYQSLMMALEIKALESVYFILYDLVRHHSEIVTQTISIYIDLVVSLFNRIIESKANSDESERFNRLCIELCDNEATSKISKYLINILTNFIQAFGKGSIPSELLDKFKEGICRIIGAISQMDLDAILMHIPAQEKTILKQYRELYMKQYKFRGKV